MDTASFVQHVAHHQYIWYFSFDMPCLGMIACGEFKNFSAWVDLSLVDRIICNPYSIASDPSINAIDD